MAWACACVACALLCLFLVFRPFWMSHFDLILSDPVDGRFCITIVEHWNRVFHGQVSMASPNFFYPERDVLGYSDGFFLISLPYVVLRRLGADQFLSMEVAMMLITLIGFASMLGLLWRTLRFSRTTALCGAFLFAASNMYYIHMVHPHLCSVAFVPLLLIFLGGFIDGVDRSAVNARLCITAFGALLALVLFTSFYTGWFTVVFLAVTSAFYCLSIIAGERSLRSVNCWMEWFWKRRFEAACGVVAFLVALIPFLIVYLPALHRTGTRPLSYTLYFMPTPVGALDAGKDSVLWGGLSARVEYAINPGGMHEHPTGWPVLTVVLFLSSTVYCARRIWRGADVRNPENRTLYLAGALAASILVLWLAGSRFDQRAPLWELLWRYVPGASAIRIPPRINLVLNTGIVIVGMYGLEQLGKRLWIHKSAACAALSVVAVALCVEQVNLMPTHLISRAQEMAKITRIKPPPHECGGFYVSSWSPVRQEILRLQTDATLAAERLGLPTLNGYSSWFPGDWDLLTGSQARIAERAREWAEWHNLSGLCSLDVNSGSWTTIDLRELPQFGIEQSQLIADAGFEQTSLGSWLPFQRVHAEISSKVAHGGNNSVAENAAGSIYQDLRGLRSGATYNVVAWFAGSVGTTATARIATLSDASTPVYSVATTPSPNWHYLSHSFIAGDSGKVRLHLMRSEGRGTVYWDDVTIYRDH